VDTLVLNYTSFCGGERSSHAAALYFTNLIAKGTDSQLLRVRRRQNLCFFVHPEPFFLSGVMR
jgi:hypothetical protein